ncbi:hypothetical protein E4U13_000729, partial [Claviceps humidiphila]
MNDQQSLEWQSPHHGYYDYRGPPRFHRPYPPSQGYSSYHGYRDPRETSQFDRPYSKSHEDPRFHQYGPPTYEPWWQPYFHSGPQGYYPRTPYQPQQYYSHNDKEPRTSQPPHPPSPTNNNNDNPVTKPQNHKHQMTESEKRELERNVYRVIRMYTTSENKYTGEEDDFFRPKLLKFREICTQWEIPEDTMPKLFPLMLTGKAAEYCTGNISPNKPGINDMIAQIQAHFETEANFEIFEGQWDELTFHKALVPDMLAEYVEHGQCERPAKASPAGTTPRPPPVHTSAHAPAAADNEEQLPVESPENASA